MIAPYAEERREQVVLWREDGVTFREIAEVIGVSAGRVRQLESKGLREAWWLFHPAYNKGGPD